MKWVFFMYGMKKNFHFPGLGGSGAAPYLPGQAQVDTHIQEQLCFPRSIGHTSSLPPKLPVYQFIAFSYSSLKNLI